MSLPTEITSLASLDYVSYLDQNGYIPEEFQGKIGVYAIFDQEKTLQFVGYSRDIYASLTQHLVRQPNSCYWLKIQTISRPSRTVLENIRQAWIEENGQIPPGNSSQEKEWSEDIDAKLTMSEADKQKYETLEEVAQTKFLKQIARRLEAEIKEQLNARGVAMNIRFDPKLKEKGLLSVK